MAYIHSKGIVHLDLKTTNILLTANKRFTVIADFGISQTMAGFGSGGAAATNPVFAADGGGGVELMPVAAAKRVSSSAMVDADRDSGLLALTPHYCAPERLLRADLAFDGLRAADVYTFGPSQRFRLRLVCACSSAVSHFGSHAATPF